MPLAEAVALHARERPHAPAFRMEGRVFTFGELAAEAGGIFAAVQRSAAEVSERSILSGRARLVSLETGNHPLFPAAFIAATAAGHCAALIDPHLPEIARQRMKERLRPEVVIRAEGDLLRIDVPSAGHSRLLQGAAGPSPAVRAGNGGEPFLVVFTSGTTGEPKAIIRNRRSWRVSLETGKGFFRLGSETTTYAPGPLAHGLTLYALAETMTAGAEFVGARHFEADQSLATIAAFRAKRLVLVPTMLRRLCERAARSPLTSIRQITIAGAKLTPADREAARVAFPNAQVTEYYGASELGFISVSQAMDRHTPTAVGKAFPGVHLAILGENGDRVPAGEAGMIFVESELVSEGYIAGGDGAGFRRHGKRATAGDLGFLDEDGTLHLIGRAGGMVVSGGNNIYPSEVESVILGAGGVNAVFVFDLDHPDPGSELAAVVEPGGGFDRAALEAHLAAALPRYKHPRKIWLCRNMPMTASGKLAAGELRRWIAEENTALERLA
ncbi:AMP-binding protein [Sinorhizobium medicae]|nr:AMP-binding protein [Sinorhizobium medicae]MDX0872934.1 AMP-binding protein [Sinorhizobium medicae]